METSETMIGGATYNKDTYIGYLKLKKGGMKVIPGDMDDNIIQKRNNILMKLEKVLSGGKSLKEKNLEKYFKALGGKYIRNDICISGDLSNCKKGKKVSLGGANKLMNIASNKFSSSVIESTFKGAAPVLYQKYNKSYGGNKHKKLESESDSDGYNGGNNNGNRYSESESYNRGGNRSYEPEPYNSDPYMYRGEMYGGDLEQLRIDIGRSNDHELNLLREEIRQLRNN